jgi:hypothetical protein
MHNHAGGLLQCAIASPEQTVSGVVVISYDETPHQNRRAPAHTGAREQPGRRSDSVPITYDAMKIVTADLYAWSLRSVPDDAAAALQTAAATETVESARTVLRFMLAAAETAQRSNKYLCTDASVPSYDLRIGTAARIEGDIKQATVDGFAHLYETIDPPLLKFITIR